MMKTYDNMKARKRTNIAITAFIAMAVITISLMGLWYCEMTRKLPLPNDNFEGGVHVITEGGEYWVPKKTILRNGKQEETSYSIRKTPNSEYELNIGNKDGKIKVNGQTLEEGEWIIV